VSENLSTEVSVYPANPTGFFVEALPYFSVRSGLDLEYTENTCFPSSSRPVPRKGSKAFLAEFCGNLVGLFSVCPPMRTRRGVSLVRAVLGVPRKWGDRDAGDMTGRSVAGWEFADGVGLALG
jgi:hypothetical protein